MFEKIGAATNGIEVLTRHQVDDQLTEILVEILVAVLKIITLATTRCNDISGEQKHLHSTKSRLSEYFRLLIAGSDVQVNDAVVKLDGLISRASQMTQYVPKCLLSLMY